MAFRIRRLDYFYTTVRDQPGEAYAVLSELAKLGVNLLAISSVPMGPATTQMTLFPEDAHSLTSAASNAGMSLAGPQQAFLVQGDDELGALAQVHAKLATARVNVFASTGVTDGKGHYGYIIYVRPDDFERAAKALDL